MIIVSLILILVSVIFINQISGLVAVFGVGGVGLFDETPDVPITIKDNKGNLSVVKTNDTIILFTDLDEPKNLIDTLKKKLEPFALESPLEARIGPLTFIDDRWLDNLKRVQRSVGLVWGEHINNATGFLISPSLFITNHHVVKTKEQLENAKVTFNYQLEDGKLSKTDTYYVNESFFITNDDKDGYDYTIVKLIGLPGADNKWGYITLQSISDSQLLPNGPVNIIQHPGGGYKQYAIQDNMLIEITPNKLIRYKTDTVKGSSGSPLFDNEWNLIGIHHAYTKPPIKINGIPIESNEGILISKIKNDLEIKLRDDPNGKRILQELYVSH